MPTMRSTRAGAVPVAEQFETAEQQLDADLLGIWLFLATEAMMFSGIFLAFSVYYHQFNATFAAAARELHWIVAGGNTAILLTSGLTAALAEQFAVAERRRATLKLLAATVCLGAVFLVLKGWEYHAEYAAGLVPFMQGSFEFPGPHKAAAMLFYDFYFAITGLHALHMLVGLGVLTTIFVLCWRWRDPHRVARQVRIASLYWAFVDIVWIVVYTSLYLVGRQVSA